MPPGEYCAGDHATGATVRGPRRGGRRQTYTGSVPVNAHSMCAARRVRLYNPCGHRVHPANHSETIHDTTHSQISRGGTGHRASYRDVRRVCDSSRHHSAR